MYTNSVSFDVLKGKTLTDIQVNEDKDVIIFTCEDGTKYMMYHDQDCCENVSIEDINGELTDLIGMPVLIAEEVTHGDETPEGWPMPDYDDSYTWTFYKLATNKGYVTIRWYGSSNGYYSESVVFEVMK